MCMGLFRKSLLMCGIFAVSVQVGAETLLARAEAYYSDGNSTQAEALYHEAFGTTEYHSAAYSRLVQVALGQQDLAGLKRLFSAHRAFAFETPQQFRPRIQLYEMVRLRNTYNAALQAALSRQWALAEGAKGARAAAEKVRKAVERYQNTGVRIEDSYLITARGLERISLAPREIDEIEALTRRRPVP